MDLGTRNRIGQPLHVIEIPRRIVAADLENVHQSVVRARYRLEFPDARVFAFVGALVVEGVAINHLYGAVGAHDIARQPDFAITAASNSPEQFVIGDAKRRMLSGTCSVRVVAVLTD